MPPMTTSPLFATVKQGFYALTVYSMYVILLR
jgi:hypothetical protein